MAHAFTDAEAERALAADTRAVTRGVIVNGLGNAAKIAAPVLLAFATRAYGGERWGLFVAIQALFSIAARVGMLGLDKALLWWVASQPAGEGAAAFAPALGLALSGSMLSAAGLYVAGEQVLSLWHLSGTALRPLQIMLLALPLFAASELQLHMCIGRKRMEPQVLVRDTLQPLAQVALAVLFAWVGWSETGLAWSFVAAHALGLGVATALRGRLFGAGAPLRARPLPRRLLRYALSAGLADLSNALLLRLDVLVLTSLTDAATVGVWGVVSQFGNSIRQIRRAFDPIVMAVAAGIAREHDPRRLVAMTSYSAQLVSLTQLPVFAFLFAFGELLLPLYGPDFARGSLPVLLLCGFWLMNGAAGLSGVVLAGYGQAGLGLLLVWLTLTVQTALLFAWIPPFGLVGAALAVGLSYSVQNLAQIAALRWRIGSFVFAARSLQPLPAAGLAATAAAGVLAVVGVEPSWGKRACAFAAFALVYVSCSLRAYRNGALTRPGNERRDALVAK